MIQKSAFISGHAIILRGASMDLSIVNVSYADSNSIPRSYLIARFALVTARPPHWSSAVAAFPSSHTGNYSRT